MELHQIFQKTAKLSLYMLVFLIPLWFLPITQDYLNFQKQSLVIFLSLVSLVTWLLYKSKEEMKLRKNILNFFVVALISATLLSTIFSLWPYASFWGLPLNVSSSFLTVLFLAVFFFLISNVLENQKEFSWLAFLFLTAVALEGIFVILQLYRIFILPASFSKIATFNTIGSVNSVAMLCSILLPLALLAAFSQKKMHRWLLLAYSAVFFIVIALVNFLFAWLALAIAFAVVAFFGVREMAKRQTASWIYVPIALLVISAFFLFTRFSLPGVPNLPIETYPNSQAEYRVMSNALKYNALLGTGPGTFTLNYAKYHTLSF